MQVTVLGCGAAYPRPGGACSGFLLEGGGKRVWLDAGNGTFSRLTERVPFQDVDALVISHSHADHIADVLPMMYALGFDAPDAPPLPVYAPPDVAGILSAPLGTGSIDFFRRVFDFRPIQEAFEVGPMRFDPFPTVHPVPTYGVRVTGDGGTFVYTADTADYPELAEDCRDADLLLCESTFVRPDVAPIGIHLWAHEAGRMAQKAEARRLVLTHVWACHTPGQAAREAETTFGDSVEAAADGAVYDV